MHHFLKLIHWSQWASLPHGVLGCIYLVPQVLFPEFDLSCLITANVMPGNATTPSVPSICQNPTEEHNQRWERRQYWQRKDFLVLTYLTCVKLTLNRWHSWPTTQALGTSLLINEPYNDTTVQRERPNMSRDPRSSFLRHWKIEEWWFNSNADTQKELQDFARNNQIDLYDCKEVIAPGWDEGKPKGLLQVLGERGLIERAALERYTLDGRKDTIPGKIDLQYSLCSLLGECKDFKEEETALQFLGTQLGVTVLLTPKFHVELAGEGVEFSWAHSKAYYQRMPLSRKRGHNNFKHLV